MDEIAILKKKIHTAFKLSGYSILSEASLLLANELVSLDLDEREKWRTLITENIQNQKLTSLNIEKHHIETALNDLSRVGLEQGEHIFSLINAFDIPRFEYCRQRKKFVPYTGSKAFIPSADKKTKFLKERYTLLLQKTTRHELFSPAIENTTAKFKKFKLYTVETLLSSSKVPEVVVLGLLTQLTEGKFHIEDPTGAVPLDLSGARYHSGFFCEGCFVLAEGKYQDGVLNVAGLGFPPPEPAQSSRAFFGTQNSWGGESRTLLKYSQKLLEIERTNTEATLIFLSDVRLDNPVTMEKLKQLFAGYDDCPPVAIVLMGPFAKPDNNMYKLKQLFQELGELANNCDRLKKETDLVLVPSMEDASAPSILPRAPIPEALVKGLKQRWKRTKLATNPCRLQYCTQQIVVCRADLVTKLCRNTLHFPDNEQLEDHFARTLICQGNLAPVNPIVLPIFWEHDAAMSLYPLPDLVVIGDPSQPFTTSQHDCTIINTGSFIKSKFAFKVYVPSTKTVEDSEIPDDMEA